MAAVAGTADAARVLASVSRRYGIVVDGAVSLDER
jgi:hypothetical protein